MVNALLFLLIIILVVVLSGIYPKQTITTTSFPTEILSRDNTQIIKGLAMIMILTQHICGNWTNIFTPFGGIGVALFLFFSGFGLNQSYKKNGIKSFWKKKIIRVICPYALFRILCVMVYNNVNLWDFLLDILCYKSEYWYIDYLIRCYIVFWIAKRFFGRYQFIILTCFAIYTFLFMSSTRSEQSLSFLIGVLSSEYYNIILKWNRKRWLIIMCLSGVFGISCLLIKQIPLVREYMGTYIYSIVELGIKLPLGIAFSIALLQSPAIIKNSSLLSICGLCSLELYLVHMQIRMLIIKDSFIQGIAIVIISLLIAYSFHKMTNVLFKTKF